MRVLLRKLEQNQPLKESEYEQLLAYIEQIQSSSPETYALFCRQYRQALLKDHSHYLPLFPAGRDELSEFLIRFPQAVEEIGSIPASLSAFPANLHPYLLYMAQTSAAVLQDLTTYTVKAQEISGTSVSLPQPRQGEVVYKFEDSNPFKEMGLKAHFDRLSRFSFITRLQSYRYLTGSKAARDRIETVDGQCLGGIFTNKEKSIYYYIFLSEDDLSKAQLACQVLNTALYGGRS